MASTQPQNQIPAATLKARSNSIVVPKMADAKVEHAVTAPAPAAPAESTDANVWTTERQLVSSLAKLQKLESMVPLPSFPFISMLNLGIMADE